MKAEFDKELDSLLRERARRTPAAPSGAGAKPFAGAHLDADEQNAYAENALPAPTRAYYAAHLADCDDCRRSVTQLALAAGMAAQLNERESAETTTTQSEVSTRITWRERLGALFAPRAWRYAVPALALLLVGVISFVVLTRRTERETSIAQHNTTDAQKPRAAATQAESHHAPQNGNLAPTPSPEPDGTLTTSTSNVPAPNANASQSREEIAANADRTDTLHPVAPATTGAVSADAPPPPVPTAGGAMPRPMPEMPPPAPTPPPAIADAVRVEGEQEAKAKSAESSAVLQKLEQRSGDFENRQSENRSRERLSGPRRNEQVQNRRANEANNTSDRRDRRGGEVAATTAAPAVASSKRAQRRDGDKDENRAAEDSEPNERAAKSAAETRTVAGRRFRRQGDAWVDTAYASGQSYTVVRRNSEQFRALTADEPQLRRIAEAFGGDVTVVWKGRAYRIR